MIRSLRIPVAVIAALAVSVAVTVPAIAAATGPKGTLTHTEYQKLTAEQVAFKKLAKKKNLTWNDFYTVCHTVGQSTALMQAVRSNCDTGIGIDQSLSGFAADAERCTALSTGTTTSTTPTSTTTTGTTTTGTGTTTTGTGTTTTATGTTTTGTGTTTTSTGTLTPTQLKLFACLEPEYAVISRALESVYQGQVSLRSKVLARDFVGRCELTLAPTVAQIKALTKFVSTSKQLTKDVALITKVSNGQAPSSAINDTQIENDSLAFDQAAKDFAALHRPQKLSVCPHQ
jgi:hypothetical protein